MTVHWLPPATNEDGSPLNDLAGYRIYYGTSSGNYSKKIEITGTTTLTYTLNNLPANTYFATVTALDKLGNESQKAPEGSKVIR